MNIGNTEGTPPNAYDPADPEGPGIPQEPVTDQDPETVQLTQNASITLLKTAELAGNIYSKPAAIGDGSQPGDIVEYTFVITNNGNVTLTDAA